MVLVHPAMLAISVGVALGVAFIMYLRREQPHHSYDRRYGVPDFEPWGRHSSEICSICLERIRSGAGERLPCNHEFHMKCLVELKKTFTSCPNCRRQF